jgi:transcriptional regulator with XRE-family HTH domain
MQVAEQVGVDATTVCNWESNATTPAIRYIPAILEFLGYEPFPPAQTFADRLTTARKVLGISQRAMALSLGVDPATLQSWEAEQHHPTAKNVELIERFLQALETPPVPQN